MLVNEGQQLDLAAACGLQRRQGLVGREGLGQELAGYSSCLLAFSSILHVCLSICYVNYDLPTRNSEAYRYNVSLGFNINLDNDINGS